MVQPTRVNAIAEVVGTRSIKATIIITSVVCNFVGLRLCGLIFSTAVADTILGMVDFG